MKSEEKEKDNNGPAKDKSLRERGPEYRMDVRLMTISMGFVSVEGRRFAEGTPIGFSDIAGTVQSLGLRANFNSFAF